LDGERYRRLLLGKRLGRREAAKRADVGSLMPTSVARRAANIPDGTSAVLRRGKPIFVA
jgi:hypothetical protein